MIDINKHRFYMVQILKEIYSDIELSNWLGFKGGSALMFFYDLPRFSVDLDFNLLDLSKEEEVYQKVRSVLLKFGTIADEAKKFFGSVIVLDFGYHERKLKVEISNRMFNDRYRTENLLGINMKVMVAEDMFANKLCALLDRSAVANRDIFDCWFFMQKQTAVNKEIVETRMKKPFSDYLLQCIEHLESITDKGLLNGLGELTDNTMKEFVRKKLRTETISLLKFYKEFPIISQ